MFETMRSLLYGVAFFCGVYVCFQEAGFTAELACESDRVSTLSHKQDIAKLVPAAAAAVCVCVCAHARARA